MSPDLKKYDSKKGFTLIELLVVIAVIGILSAIGLTSYNQAREKARDAQRKSDLASYRSALLFYYDDNEFLYPDTADVGGAPDAFDDGVGIFDADDGNNPIVSEYMASLVNPPTDDAAFGYWYDSNAAGTAFILYTHLEGVDTDWYWIDSNGGNDLELNANAHTDANCEADSTCTW